MRLTLISCDVFEPEVKAAAARSSNHIDFEFLPKALHRLSDPDKVGCIQALINRVRRSKYHAVLLVAGSCKNGLDGLVAGPVPLVLPRAKDCISLLLPRPSVAREAPHAPQPQAASIAERARRSGRSFPGTGSGAWLAPAVRPMLGRDRHGFSLGCSWNWRKRFGSGEPGHCPGSIPTCQTSSTLEMLVNGYWNYTDFLVVAPRWRVVVHHDEGSITAEELT